MALPIKRISPKNKSWRLLKKMKDEGIDPKLERIMAAWKFVNKLKGRKM
jgi:hypothetical protein